MEGATGGPRTLEELFLGLGIANSLALIVIFLVRGARGTALLRRFGPAYLVLSIPAVAGIALVLTEQKPPQYAVFLGIFLAYLLLEGLYDFVWKVAFRENWKLATPYLALYFAMNYGFVVMVWKVSSTWGIVMLALFVLQIAANIATHPPMRPRSVPSS